MDHLFKNPFGDYNANVMDSSMILQYWCSPFSFSSSDFKENEMYADQNAIAFMGGRGSGKTMFLKYWSFDVQRKKIEFENPNRGSKKQLEKLLKLGGLGIYLRIDGPELRSFNGKGVDDEKWSVIFTHFFELVVAQEYFEILSSLDSLGAFDGDELKKKFLPKIASMLGLKSNRLKSFEDIIDYTEDMLAEVKEFRSKVLFSDRSFSPKRVFEALELSNGIAVELAKFDTKFASTPFVILIDEFENYSRYQQKVINTVVKFTKPSFRLRLGMRLEGFRTYATVSKNEFVKENRDYRKVVFDASMIKNDTEYREFLKIVACRRLEAVDEFRLAGVTEIEAILGKSENLELEAKELLSGRKSPKRHYSPLEKQFSKSQLKEMHVLLGNDNPLLEMLNIVRVVKGESPENVAEEMSEYLTGTKSDKAEKYRMDYVDKYKLSLMFLLANLYKSRKLYYSFNTFCFLSSGIVGHFIELCRRTFQIAYFEEKEELFEEKQISPAIQDRAARVVARTELDMVRRISIHGDRLTTMILNLGNIFREYHTDVRIRYPETNQVAIDRSTLSDDLQEVFNSAIEWSILQKKPHLQSARPSSEKTDLYTLNRIFAPRFEISYRTRGGFNEVFDRDEFKKLITEKSVKAKLPDVKDEDTQGRLF